MLKRATGPWAATGLLVIAYPACAQNAAPPPAAIPEGTNSADAGVTDIVVTAQRRSQRLQEVPIAISAVSSAQIATKGLTDIRALSSAIPSLQVNINGNAATPFLRGVGSNSGNPNDEPSVATYVDGVYLPSPTATIFDFSNVERIEVLKGPQGTLFGRNSTGGVIQIITRDPGEDAEMNAAFGYGNYQTVNANAYVAGGLAKGVALSVSGTYSHQNRGFGRNLTTGEDTFTTHSEGLRGKLLITPGESTEIRVSADYEKYQDTNLFINTPGTIQLDGNTVFVGDYNGRNEFPDISKVRQYGGSIRLDQDFGAARFVSITGYRRSTGLFSIDQDTTPLPAVQSALQQFNRSFSQEVQLISPTNSKIDWLIGGYYFNASAGYDPGRIGGFAASPLLPYLDIFGEQKTRSFSAYGQATVEVLPATKLTGGLRYTSETIRGISSISSVIGILLPETQNRSKFSRLTYRAALDHQFSEEIRAYLSFNRGFKSGGFNLVSPGTQAFAPESLDAYEFGVKTELFDRKLRFNAAAFYYNYKDIQVQFVGSGSLGAVNADAHIKGVDFDFEARPFRNLSISGGGSYLDGNYTRFPLAKGYFQNATAVPAPTIDAAGNSTIQTPKWTANLSADLTIPSSIGDFVAGGSYSYNSGSFASPDNRLRYNAYSLVNLSLRWTEPGGHFGLRAYVRNLTDKRYYYTRLEQDFLGDLQIAAPPRTYGLTASVSFR